MTSSLGLPAACHRPLHLFGSICCLFNTHGWSRSVFKVLENGLFSTSVTCKLLCTHHLWVVVALEREQRPTSTPRPFFQSQTWPLAEPLWSDLSDPASSYHSPYHLQGAFPSGPSSGTNPVPSLSPSSASCPTHSGCEIGQSGCFPRMSSSSAASDTLSV